LVFGSAALTCCPKQGARSDKFFSYTCSSLLVDEAHGGGRAHIDVLRLDPLVAHLGICHVICVLRANLTIVVHFVTQGVGVITVIDGALTTHVKLVMGRLLRRVSHKRLLSIGVVEVRLLKEVNAVGAQSVICDGSTGLVGALVLGLAAETSIARLEVRAGNV